MKKLIYVLLFCLITTVVSAQDTRSRQCTLLGDHSYQMYIAYYYTYPDLDLYLDEKVPMLVNMLVEKFEEMGARDKIDGNVHFKLFNQELIEGAIETIGMHTTLEEAESSALRIRELTTQSCEE